MRTILAEELSGDDLLIEKGLALLNALRESLLLGLPDLVPDGVLLSLVGQLGLLLLGALLAALVSPQVAAKVSVAPSLVVEVGSVC